MSFDIPKMHFPDDSPEARTLEAIIDRDHVSVEEAVRLAIRTAEIKSAPVKEADFQVQDGSSGLAIDDQLRRFKELYPGLGLLDDVTDEQWDRILKGTNEMNKEGFPLRG